MTPQDNQSDIINDNIVNEGKVRHKSRNRGQHERISGRQVGKCVSSSCTREIRGTNDMSCSYRDSIVANLEQEIEELLQLLKLEKENKATAEAHWKEILDKNNTEHCKKLTEMATITACQKKVLLLPCPI